MKTLLASAILLAALSTKLLAFDPLSIFGISVENEEPPVDPMVKEVELDPEAMPEDLVAKLKDTPLFNTGHSHEAIGIIGPILVKAKEIHLNNAQLNELQVKFDKLKQQHMKIIQADSMDEKMGVRHFMDPRQADRLSVLNGLTSIKDQLIDILN